MTNTIHLTPEGPALCSATVRSCKYGAHFKNVHEAEQAFAEKMGGAVPAAARASIELSSNIGAATVINGDLSDPTARALLATGKCGDLALAIHRKTGATPYFVHYDHITENTVAEMFQKDPDSVFRIAQHVVVESPTTPGMFLDSYGQHDLDSILESWEAGSVVRASTEMLERFADETESERLSKFADAAIELDKHGISYDYAELDEYSDDEDYQDDDDEW